MQHVFNPSPWKTALAFGVPIPYVIAVLWGIRHMKSRPPLDVNRLAIVHSAFLCVASLIMWLGLVVGAVQRLAERGAFALFCDVNGGQEGTLAFWTEVYWLSKFPELLDTAILICKKKDIIFLHVFHHAVMCLMPFMWLYADWTLVWFGCTMNCAIHVFMYGYFAGAAYNGYNPWWKKLLTSAQILQFFLVLFAIIAFQVTRDVLGVPCAGNGSVIWFSQGVNVVFLITFIRFFLSAYGGSSSSSSKKKTLEKQK